MIPPEFGDNLDGRIERELESDRSKRVWGAATGEAHRELVRLIEDDGATRGDIVTLERRSLIRSVARAIGVPSAGLAPDAGRVQIVAGDQVRGAREGADQLQRVALVLLVAAPAVLLMAMAAAGGWRRRALAGVGVAVAVAGGAVLLARALVGAHVVEVLTPGGSDRAAVEASWSVGTTTLAWAAGAAVVAGLVVAVAARASAPRGEFL